MAAHDAPAAAMVKTGAAACAKGEFCSMASILDYLDWRGDIAFSTSPFNEVDNLILSELAYMDCQGIATDQGLALREAARLFLAQGRGEIIENVALFQADKLCPLLRAAAQSERFGGVQVLTPVQLVDEKAETQFAATAFDLGQSGIYLAYSGTDDTLIGWKEDFNLSYMESVPAQRMALEYLLQMAAAHPGRPLMLGGHSKGGNLALYAALNAPKELAERITAVYSNDGPGFREHAYEGPAYRRLQSRIHSIVPQESIIGMLLEHPEDYKIVCSQQKGILQHDAFSWQVMRNEFVPAVEKSEELELNEQMLRGLVGSLTEEQLRDLTNALFEILTGSGATTTTELRDEGIVRSLPAMLKAYDSLDEDTKRLVWVSLEKLAGEGAQLKLRRLKREVWAYLSENALEPLRRKGPLGALRELQGKK